MQEFDPLMKAGKHKEAEAVLDRALKLLRGPDNEEKEPKKNGGYSRSSALKRAGLQPCACWKCLTPARLLKSPEFSERSALM